MPAPADPTTGRTASEGGTVVAARAAVPGATAPPTVDEPAIRSAAQQSGALPARAELRRQMRTQQRLRLATLISVVVVILGALPAYLMIQNVTRDPVFTSLNALQVPAWAAGTPSDTSFGSRWCIMQCRFRERELTSQRSTAETATVYQNALREAGWQPWKVEQCPDGDTPGNYSCWRRDEYTLDLWVRDPTCASDPLRQRPTVGPPGTTPSTGANADGCTGSAVTIKVRNRIDDERGRGGVPTNDPSLTGETPDPALTGDPLSPTPTN